MSYCLPVTLIGGFLGAGKTSLLHHVVSEYRGGHLALLVENPGALNLDAKALRGLCGAMRRTTDVVREIPDGSETDQLEWLAAQFRELAAQGRYERVLVEVGGTTNAHRFARHFQPGGELAAWAEWPLIVCVVDALDFCHLEIIAQDEAMLCEFQREQIRGADFVVLNKCDLIDEAERAACGKKIRALNPGARLIETEYGEVPPDLLGSSPGLRDLSAGETSASSDCGPVDLASVVYRAYRPFHPERFWNWFNAEHPGLLRVKGVVWLATRNLLVGGVSRTRWQNACGAAGIWWAALPREEWPQDSASLQKMQETWREPYGDRRQELVLIGGAAQVSSLTGPLNSCLLTTAEYARPVSEWSTFPDPFPAWDLEHA